MPLRAREIIRILLDHGCIELRQTGSHRRFVSPCGQCHTTVAVHKGEDVKDGTARGIQKDMLKCLGPNWLLKR